MEIQLNACGRDSERRFDSKGNAHFCSSIVTCSFVLLCPFSSFVHYYSVCTILYHKSISTCTHYVTLDNKIKCLSLAVFLWQRTNKTGTAYMWGLLIANHLDQSFWLTNQKYWAPVRSNLLHFFLEVHNCVAALDQPGKLHEFGAEKPISWAKPAHFDFFPINFTVWSHVLSTVGDALSGVAKW